MASRHMAVLAQGSLLASLLAFSSVAIADANSDKAVQIAEKEANSQLSGRYNVDCGKPMPKDYKWVEASKAEVKDQDSLNWRVSWKGKTPEGIEYEFAIDVMKDLSGSFNTRRKMVVCNK